MFNPSVPVVMDADTFCKHFRDVFAKPQYAHFYSLVISMMVAIRAHRVTDAVRLFEFRRHWTNAYGFLRSRAWDAVALLQALWALIFEEMKRPSRVFLILDDTTVRHAGARKIPGVRSHYNASAQNDPCRPRKIWGHQWILLGLAAMLTPLHWECLPLCAQLVEKGVSKLELALRILASIRIPATTILTVIADGWYTKCPFLQSLREMKVHYIGKVRRDARVYDLPKAPDKPKRGRPAMKGQRVYLADITTDVPEISGASVVIRKLKRKIDAWSRILVLKNGLNIKVVVARWRKKNGREKWLYLLCTDLEFGTLEIIRHYDARWMIEPCFCDLKQKGGFASYSGRSLRGHNAWAQICCVARTLLVLLRMKKHCVQIDPWRHSTQPDYATSGQMRAELTMNFEHFLQLTQDAHNSADSGIFKCQ